MDDTDRPHRLAEAIDRLLRGEEPSLDDQELAELLQIARARRAVSRQAASLSERYREFVWARVEARIMQLFERQGKTQNSISNSPQVGSDGVAENGLRSAENDELDEVFQARHRFSLEISSMAEAYRELVWQRVQARIRAAPNRPQHRFSLPHLWRRGGQKQADKLSQQIDQLILGEPIWEAEDSSLKDLVRLARLRHSMSKALASSATSYEGRLWVQMQSHMRRAERGHRAGPHVALRVPALSAPWPRLAAAALVLAFAILAIGPLPATGLAHHPIRQFVDLMGRLIGVTETDTPPPLIPATQTIEGSDVSIAEAEGLMDLALLEPRYLPQGLNQVASHYFAGAITADSGGLYQTAYGSPDAGAPALVIWQEAASANTIAVQTGYTEAITLDPGLPATYVEGMWQVEGSIAQWGDEAARTVIFDQGPVRVFVVYVGGAELTKAQLVDVASSMVTP